MMSAMPRHPSKRRALCGDEAAALFGKGNPVLLKSDPLNQGIQAIGHSHGDPCNLNGAGGDLRDEEDSDSRSN
ncbi:hypothetical protein ACP_0886 [Acidobacterium capsulatum ATCC 51196]|uniref:Uncharacterized protein n=1 Tax=Acidobacterium capsulatum (strain ATCC 51196 / DSM 11244 / BCRC 80197 / JCM 7670 / NBRC 15755 / NCIMB 13165 / 161) TaxID=240015 RepID=C1F2Y6_ACIC5|nr:hypothetical protein ACP_0886 [Acidobacterium capsulatum ATCC 51196]